MRGGAAVGMKIRCGNSRKWKPFVISAISNFFISSSHNQTKHHDNFEPIAKNNLKINFCKKTSLLTSTESKSIKHSETRVK